MCVCSKKHQYHTAWQSQQRHKGLNGNTSCPSRVSVGQDWACWQGNVGVCPISSSAVDKSLLGSQSDTFPQFCSHFWEAPSFLSTVGAGAQASQVFQEWQWRSLRPPRLSCSSRCSGQHVVASPTNRWLPSLCPISLSEPSLLWLHVFTRKRGRGGFPAVHWEAIRQQEQVVL